MIINHNMMANNAIRNMNINSSNASKSMQKLSSGLRINTAADDAAGLSISEKMRGQIRGLDQASSNAQDGISMVQTAEGALSETTSILQRMRELATQASNDTNVTVDRSSIQSEMNQLSSEINRIGNTTEFNTQKLLNGGTQIQTNATAASTKLQGGTAAANTNATAGGAAGINAVATKWISGNIAPTTGIANGDTFTFGGTTVTINIAAADATHIAGTGTLAAGNTGTAATLNFVTGDASLTNATTIRDALVSAFSSMKSVAGSPIANITFAANGASGISATDTAADGATNNAWLFGTTSSTASFANATAAAQEASGVGGAVGVTGAAATSTMAFSGAAQEGSYVVMADKKIAFWDSTSNNFADAAEAKSALNADYVVDVAGVTTATGMSAAVLSQIGATGIGGWTLADNGSGTNTLTANTTGVFQGHNRAQAVDIATSTAATGSMTFTDKPAEGSYITIEDKKIGFYDSSLGNYATDAEAKIGTGTDFVVDTKGLTKSQIVDKITELQSSLNTSLTKDVNLAKTVNNDGSVTLNITAQTAGFGGNTIKTEVSKNTTKGFEANYQIGANTAQSMTVELNDMRSSALGVTSNDATKTTVTAKNGSIASYVATTSVTDGTSNTATEYSLDVSTHDKATAAISVINDAIEAVSAERSKLGAYQNRLEHTINNLGTSSENLTSAESRIRDVDMAKEMSTFSKNNILSQAAQAMLAQANQQPQQVLQLLR